MFLDQLLELFSRRHPLPLPVFSNLGSMGGIRAESGDGVEPEAFGKGDKKTRLVPGGFYLCPVSMPWLFR